MSEQSEAIKQKDVSSSHWEQFNTIAAHPDGSVVACGGHRPGETSHFVTLFDVETGSEIKQFEHTNGSIQKLVFCTDTLLVCGSSTGYVSLWDLSKKKPKQVASLQPFERDVNITALAVTADASTVFIGDQEGGCSALSLPKLKPSKTPYAWPTGIALHSIVTDPKGAWVAAAGEDGVIRVFQQENGELQRTMEGHEGTIYTMLLNPSDNRLISAGEDRAIHLWYLQGEVEFENRAASAQHEGAIRSLALGPVYTDDSGEVIPPRLFTASEDGTLKIWPLGNKRKPKTIDFARVSTIDAVCLPSEKGSRLLAVGSHRLLQGWAFNTQTELEGSYLRIESAFHTLQRTVRSSEKKYRTKAYKTLAAHIVDSDVYEELLYGLKNEAEPSLRVQITEYLTSAVERRPIRKLREVLNDSHKDVRKAALLALRELQGEEHLSPLAHALKSSYADVRTLAVQQLPALAHLSPQPTQLISNALYDDADSVKVAALDALELVYPSTKDKPNPKAFEIAFTHHSEVLRKELIQRIYARKWTNLTAFKSMLSRSLEDDSPLIRNLAFEVLLTSQPELTQALCSLNGELQRAIQALDESEKTEKSPKKESDSKQKKASKSTQRPEVPTLAPETLEPLILAQLCKANDISLRASVLLAELHDIRSMGTLLKYTLSHDTMERKDAASALQWLTDPNVIPSLRRLLSDAHEDVRSTAFDSLEVLLSDPVSLAEAGLQSTQSDIRNRALQRLVPTKGAELAERIEGLVQRTLSDPNQEVRSEAFKILWNQYIKTEPEKCLLPAFKSQSEAMQKQAVDEMLRDFFSTEWTQNSLQHALFSPSSTVREHTYSKWVKAAPKGDISPHEYALQSPYAGLRKQAIQKLSSFKLDQVRPLLLNAVQDSEQAVRTVALEQLLKRFSKDADALAETLKTPFWHVRLRVAKHLAGLGDVRALEVVKDYIQDERERLLVLAPPTPPQTEPSLDQLTQQERQELTTSRLQIIEVVKILAVPEGVEFILDYLQDEDETKIVEQTAFAISRSAAPEHADTLIEWLKHKNFQVQVTAAEGLARQGREEGWSTLESLSKQATSRVDSQRALAASHTLLHRGEQYVLQATNNEDESVHTAALFFLLAEEIKRARKGESPEHLMTLSLAEHDAIRLEATKILSLRADRKAFEAYIYALAAQSWPDSTVKKEQTAKERAVKLLPTWFAALASDTFDIRFSAASLIQKWNQPEDFAQTLKHTFRHFAKPKLAALSKTDSAASAEMYAQIASGTYSSILREDSLNASKLEALKQLTQLSVDKLLPSALTESILEHTLQTPTYEPDSIRIQAFTSLQALYSEGALEPFELGLQAEAEAVGQHILTLTEEKKPAHAQNVVMYALNSKNRNVRYRAADLLSGYYDEDSLEPFLVILDSEYPDVRLRVLEQISLQKDERLLEAVQKALHSDHDVLRLKAAQLLAENKNELCFPVLKQFLQREDSDLQDSAIQAMETLHSAETIEAWIERIEFDPEGTAQRSRIVQAMGNLRDPQAVSWLVQELNSTEYSRASNAFNALIAIAGYGKERDTDHLVEYMDFVLQSRNASMRTRALENIESLEHAQVQPLLIRAFNDRDESIRDKAVEIAIQRMPKYEDNTEILLPLLQYQDSGSTSIRLNAACKLAEKQQPEAFLPLFTTFQTSMDTTEQIRSVDALGQLGNSRALEPLLALWAEDAEYHSAQQAALEAIGRLATDEHRAEIKVLLQTQLNNSSTDIRVRALRGICHLEPQNAVRNITQVVRQASGWSGWRLRQICAEMLSEWKTTESEEALFKMLSDDDSDVSGEALKSLFKILGKDNTKLHTYILDSDAFEYDTERREKAAKHLAEHASTIELLGRLPALVSDTGQDDLFIDESYSSKQEESPSQSSNIARIFQNGLLHRQPVPLKELYEGLSHEKIYVRNNTVYLLTQLDAKEAAPHIREVLSELPKEWTSEAASLNALASFWNTSLWSLSQLDTQESIKASIEVLEEALAPTAVQALAARLLGENKESTPAILNALQKALQHEQEKVRRQASWSLAEVGWSTQDTPLYPSASHHLLQTQQDSSDSLIESLLTYEGQREWLPGLIAQERVDIFISMTQPKQKESAQRIAIQALSSIANEQAIEVLGSLRQNEELDQDVRLQAYRAWRRARRQQTVRA